jgi:energy-coupling factor transporter ATP-binding protein EcfA2
LSMDKIIVSKFNIEAIKAIKKALSSKDVNPLFIYGPSGSGKSFLVQRMKEKFKGRSEIIKAEEIDSQFIEQFIKNDLLIIEDIQLLKNYKPVPENLLDIIDYFIKNEKQIVLTADRHLKGLNMPNRIISRIESGVIVPIKEFDTLSRKKVLETLGKGLPQKFLKKLQQSDIKTVNQAIGAIKKVRVLGYVPEEKDRIEEEKRIREEKEKKKEEIKKQASEFERFIQDVKRGFSEELEGSEKEEILRDEYRAKMFVWKMKGFNTNRIKKVINGNLDLLTGEFVSYTTDIQRLIELQKRYGMLAVENLIKNSIITKEETKDIENALFNPDKVEWLTKTISKLEEEEDKLTEKARKKLEISEKKQTEEKELSKEKIKNLKKVLTMDLRDESFRLIGDF